MTFKHKSVLLEETIDSLNIKPDGIYVDGTLGGGGHASQVCQRLNSQGRLIGIDQDGAAILAASQRLKEYEDKVGFKGVGNPEGRWHLSGSGGVFLSV